MYAYYYGSRRELQNDDLNAINILYPRVMSISGSNTICSNGSSTYSVNLTSGYSVEWTSQPSGKLIITSPYTSQTSVSLNGVNSATLVATITGFGNTYNLQKIINLSPPQPSRMEIDMPSGTCVTPYTTRTYTSVPLNGTMENIQKVEWQVIDYNTNQNLSYTTQTINNVVDSAITLNIPGHGQDYVIGIIQRSLDKCGNYSDWGPGDYLMVRSSCSGSGGYYLKVSPNPATAEVNVVIQDDDEAKAEDMLKATVDRLNGSVSKTIQSVSVSEKILEVYDLRGIRMLNRKYTGDDYNLNISSLPTGIYILKVTKGATTFEQKFIKK